LRLIIHDLTPEAFALLPIGGNDTGNTTGNTIEVIAAEGGGAPCRGCFGCWLKTPGRCFIHDKLTDLGGLIGKSEEMVLISRNRYGGYSEPVKRALDRGISSSLPFFTFRDGALRHIPRYKSNKSCLTVLLYGGFSDLEQETAGKIVESNRSNLGFKEKKLIFVEKISDLPEAVLCI
jgi:multimeric flavodoxin WrbA